MVDPKRTMLAVEPMRSVIYGDCVREEYRIKLYEWLLKYHIEDSISQFGPYVTKYAFYFALPRPEGSEKWGAVRLHLCEHYWLCNPNDVAHFQHNKAFTERMPIEVARWQGNIPDVDTDVVNQEGDDARAAKGDGSENTRPFVFAFLPVWWEEDFKGAGRTVDDGPNYRWQIIFKYPDEAKDAADQWVLNDLIPAFADCEETNRILSSRVIKEANGCEFDRVVEIWFDGPEEWTSCIKKVETAVEKPEWAEKETFPYLKRNYSVQSIFVPDYATTDNLTQFRGYITMR